ncbi:RDD family protein [Aeromicrobium marinum DSM 15272]|uniref:RDD family protein n=1 Tax=Aeromicrobium marinum DSM 15272 TaxID=585531 RepID=E2SAR1_9ACTN|nr:RDD family protein [Aeromicrobium marinum DSM 15272]
MGRRLLALVIDWAVAALTAALLFGVGYPPEITENLVISAVFLVEVGVLTGLIGVSIGKRVMRLGVEGPDSAPIGVPRALLRTALLLTVLPAVVMTEDKRGLHDLAARSRVIHVPRQR